MPTSKHKARDCAIAFMFIFVIAGGVLTPTTSSCACESDPESAFLLDFYVGADLLPVLINHRAVDATRNDEDVERVYAEDENTRRWSPSLRLTRDTLLVALPLGTSKEEFMRINEETRLRNRDRGARTSTKCSWNSIGNLYDCKVPAGRSWFNAIERELFVTFDFGRTLRLEHIRVLEHESRFGRKTVREM